MKFIDKHHDLLSSDGKCFSVVVRNNSVKANDMSSL